MFPQIDSVLSSGLPFLPHGFCIQWDPALLWSLVGANTVIGLSYVAIAGLLLHFVHLQKTLQFRLNFILFAAFILLCGLTHFIDVATIWRPVYHLDDVTLLATAVVSGATAVVLRSSIPRIAAYFAERRLHEEQLLIVNRQLAESTRQLEQHAEIQRQNLITAEQFHLLVDSVADYAIYLLDASGRIITWNAGAERIKGYAASEVIGRHIRLFYTHEDIERGVPENSLRAAEREGKVFTESWRVRKDGSRFMAQVTVTAIRDRAGVLTGFSKVTRDVTPLKEAERARAEVLRQQAVVAERQRSADAIRSLNEILTAILDASPMGIITLDNDGIIETWNRAAEFIYERHAEDVLGQARQAATDEIMLHGVGMSSDEIVALAGGDRTLRDIEVRRKRQNGSVATLCMSTAPLVRDNGQRRGTVFIVEDITQRKALADQLRQSQKMEAIGQLTGGIAHDFNNLLSIVICNLELLHDALIAGSEVRDLCDAAMDASLRGADLIRQMLAYSRKQSLEPRLLQINDLVRDTTRLLQRTLGAHVEISLNIDPVVCQVMIDPVQFQTALTNLATNARDAMPQGGRLVIATSDVVLDEYATRFADVPAGDYVLIEVTDSGCGMTPEVVERAFDPFFTTKRAGQGTGLGLSMAFGFVKQSGGHIRIYSEPGHGTTIKMYLPCRKEAELIVPEAAVPMKSMGIRRGTVLVVEDNEALATLVQSMFEAVGLTPTMAVNGRDALNILGAAPFDLLFTDIVMPGGMNGVELARRALSLQPQLKVLFTSGFTDAAFAPADSAMLADRLLPKPYRRADFIKKVQSVLDST